MMSFDTNANIAFSFINNRTIYIELINSFLKGNKIHQTLFLSKTYIAM